MPPPEPRGRYSTRYGMYTTPSTRAPRHSYTYTESRSSSSDYISRPAYSSADYISAQVDPAPSAYDYELSEDYISRPYESRADYITPRSRTPSPAPVRRGKAVSGFGSGFSTADVPVAGRKGKKNVKRTGVSRRDSGVAASPRTRPPLSSLSSGSSFSAPIERASEAPRRCQQRQQQRQREHRSHSNSPSSVGSPRDAAAQRRGYGFVADQAWEERRRETGPRREIAPQRDQGFASSSAVHHAAVEAPRVCREKQMRGRTLPGAFVDEEVASSPPQDDDNAGSDVSTFRSGSASGLGTPLLSPSFSAPYSLSSSRRRGSDYDDVYDSECDRSDASDVVRDRSFSSSSSSEDEDASDEDDISNGSDYVFDGEAPSDAESIGERSDVAEVSDAGSEEPAVKERERGYREAYVEDDYEGYSDDDD